MRYQNADRKFKPNKELQYLFIRICRLEEKL